ncbi:MAG: copper homeostasis protein CutC [Ignavibacteriales bacterium]|nr:copper homeostasis protein CutC [Ignavibacteriales bacterium]
MSTEKILLEACVDSIESAMAAQEGGADRIELCADLLEGGTTPSAGTIDSVCKNVNIPIMVMIRPRGGDFCYSDLEFEEMERDIEFIKQFNVAGIVLGILLEDGTVDKERANTLIQLARPMQITFHRAFDMTRNPLEALDDLIALGVERVLTSGQESNVITGIEMLKKLVEKAGDKIIILPGGGINENNVAEIISRCGAKEIHASARVKKESRMKFRNSKTTMSDSKNMPEYETMVTSAARIRAIKENIK